MKGKRGKPDLFGAPAQADLFGPAPAEPAWRPNPDKVRARLERILAEARAAETMPWDQARQNLFAKIFPDMAGLLPADEGRQYVLQFEQEWERLKAA